MIEPAVTNLHLNLMSLSFPLRCRLEHALPVRNNRQVNLQVRVSLKGASSPQCQNVEQSTAGLALAHMASCSDCCIIPTEYLPSEADHVTFTFNATHLFLRSFLLAPLSSLSHTRLLSLRAASKLRFPRFFSSARRIPKGGQPIFFSQGSERELCVLL